MINDILNDPLTSCQNLKMTFDGERLGIKNYQTRLQVILICFSNYYSLGYHLILSKADLLLYCRYQTGITLLECDVLLCFYQSISRTENWVHKSSGIQRLLAYIASYQNQYIHINISIYPNYVKMIDFKRIEEFDKTGNVHEPRVTRFLIYDKMYDH